MPELSIVISAEAVAWYAAVVSTIGVTLGILNHIGDRRMLKISASHGFLTGMGDGSTKVFLTAANIGKRPVTVEGVGFTFRDKNSLAIMRTPNLNLPKTLKEGQSCSTWIDHAEFLDQLKNGDHTIKDVKKVWFRDSTGKRYESKFKLKW